MRELINQTFHNFKQFTIDSCDSGTVGTLGGTIGQWARQCLIVNTCKMQMSRVERRVESRVRASFHCAIYHNLDAYIANAYSKFTNLNCKYARERERDVDVSIDLSVDIFACVSHAIFIGLAKVLDFAV